MFVLVWQEAERQLQLHSYKLKNMRDVLLRFLAFALGRGIFLFAELITAVRGVWAGAEPVNVQRIYYANHTSHGDFVLIWTVLPSRLRQRTRPVAGSDYWLKNSLRKFIGCNVFNAVLIERNAQQRTDNPIAQIGEALEAGDSLILFPEGTRNTTDEKLLPFKSGLFNLARQWPSVELVPVWIDNLNQVMPKGEFVPVPLICTVTFGAPLEIPLENKNEFLQKATNALLALAPSAAAGHLSNTPVTPDS